jgi:hypothetical protein
VRSAFSSSTCCSDRSSPIQPILAQPREPPSNPPGDRLRPAPALRAATPPKGPSADSRRHREMREEDKDRSRETSSDPPLNIKGRGGSGSRIFDAAVGESNARDSRRGGSRSNEHEADDNRKRAAPQTSGGLAGKLCRHLVVACADWPRQQIALATAMMGTRFMISHSVRSHCANPLIAAAEATSHARGAISKR